LSSTEEKRIIPVILSVKGEQYYEGQDPDSTELTTEGTMSVLPDGFLLSYKESALTGMEGTTTSFEIRGKRVLLTRSGKVNSQMIFEEGRQYTSFYETPYGDLTIDICTSSLKCTMTERGGLLEVHYTIAVEHTETGRNSFRVRVREK
jgi:uncharacterized beta-barrel protein YwiB (DUF1934 family)